MSEFILVDEKYREGFVVEKYKGSYSLNAARQYDKDGETKVAVRWGEVEVGAKKEKKKLPMGVNLGTDPGKILRRALSVIESSEGVPF
jgi:hypothetical protein